ncbi:Actin-related protein 4 [Porphyridium purpureum]|uniref:Actin-related protein 4 n=1 Tax=Porphyridium purpureum TaxID=35688 RepID=A0A5J4YTE0_PORPP|nr:Actin-related protein 4 [Porphyridium purpureum]|eukprot:POR9467..scf227_4
MYTTGNAVPAVVLDLGTHTSKCGFAGEDLPSRVFASAMGVREPRATTEQGAAASPQRAHTHKVEYVVGDEMLTKMHAGLEMASAFGNDGVVSHWHAFENLLDYCFTAGLRIDAQDYALMFAEPVYNSRAAREKLCQLVLEKYNAPAIFTCKAPVLSAFANGKTAALVLDLGASGTTAVPVFDGAVVKNKVLFSPIGGQAIGDALLDICNERKVDIRPSYKFRRTTVSGGGVPDSVVPQRLSSPAASDGAPNASEAEDPEEERAFDVQELEDRMLTTPSYDQWRRSQIIDDIKESGIMQVSDSSAADAAVAQGDLGFQLPGMNYYLPDGNKLVFGQERYKPAGLLFSKLPVVSFLPQYDATVNGTRAPHNMGTRNGLSDLVKAAIERCDASMHRDLYSSVCLTGGCSNFPGLFERLGNELMYITNRVRVIAAQGKQERRYCAWTGGSILATFSEFQRLWFSRTEYEEHGAPFIHKKCS